MEFQNCIYCWLQVILVEDQNFLLLLCLGRVKGSRRRSWGSRGERTWHHTGRTWSNTAWQGTDLSGAMKNNFLLKKQHEGRLLGLDTKNMSHAERMRAWLWPPDLNVKDRRLYCTCMPWSVYSTLIIIWRIPLHQPEPVSASQCLSNWNTGNIFKNEEIYHIFIHTVYNPWPSFDPERYCGV